MTPLTTSNKQRKPSRQNYQFGNFPQKKFPTKPPDDIINCGNSRRSDTFLAQTASLTGRGKSASGTPAWEERGST